MLIVMPPWKVGQRYQGQGRRGIPQTGKAGHKTADRAAGNRLGELFSKAGGILPMSTEARREVQLFLVLTFLFSAPVYGIYLLAVNLLPEMPAGNPRFITVFTWTPGAAAVATRWIVRRTLRGLGWGWGRTHFYLAGVIVLPFLLGFFVYLPIWTSGLGTFRRESLDGAVGWLHGHGLGGVLGWLVPLLVISLGEEVGWRGLLTPQLSRITSFAKTSLVTGLVWAVWHFPINGLQLVYFRPGVPGWYALLCFTITVVCLSFFFSWVRLRSASLWPAVVLHASCNAAQFTLEDLTKRTILTEYLTFQYGAGFALASCLLLGLFWKRLQASPAGGA
jgi:membrane protease YdiL (CAAX protease family)